MSFDLAQVSDTEINGKTHPILHLHDRRFYIGNKPLSFGRNKAKVVAAKLSHVIEFALSDGPVKPDVLASIRESLTEALKLTETVEVEGAKKTRKTSK